MVGIKRFLCACLCIVIALGMVTCAKPWLKGLEAGECVPADYGDVILVLGGGLRPNLNFGYSTAERLKLAVSLYRQNSRAIIVSDGSLYRGSPAVPVMKTWLTRQGVAPEHIILEGRSQNTLQNLTHGLALVRSRGFQQVIACTSPYHQARVKMLMQHLDYPDFRIARMDESEIRFHSGVRQWLRNLRLIAREYLAILRFRLFRSALP